jgi:Protein of unknown function (DUF3300)
MHRGPSPQRRARPFRALALRGFACILLLQPVVPVPALAQDAQPVGQAAARFNLEQLDALLAPIALYPDTLLTQMLMASTYPVQIVQAARWLDQAENKALTEDALATALQKQNWDPSVKSLAPFPQVLQMMNEKLEWTEQLGYAVATQQADVLDSVQRLRRQAQVAGSLASTPQQVVRTEAPGGGATTPVPGAAQTIVIEPTSPNVVYVPTYNPAVVYGAWPYPAYPPVALPPPPGYVAGTALAAGLAFGTGLAITASLWNVGYPNWGGGTMNVNVNHYNNINVNRAQISSNTWRAANGTGAGVGRPERLPAGSVGQPARTNGLPANAIGRSNVQVPANLVNRSTPSGGAAPRAAGTAQSAGQRPGTGNRPAPTQRPDAGSTGGRVANGTGPLSGRTSQGAANRSGAGNAAPRQPTSGNRPAGAFGGMADGRQAGQFSARGNQSRDLGQTGGARQPGVTQGGRGGRRG